VASKGSQRMCAAFKNVRKTVQNNGPVSPKARISQVVIPIRGTCSSHGKNLRRESDSKMST